MCGLVGAYSFAGVPLDPVVLRKMMALQRHRGPDDDGARLFSLRTQDSTSFQPDDSPSNHTFEGGVGFNRLSILDVSPEGHQPMSSADGQVFIAYNGETYNAFDHNDELRAAGYNFHGHSDTEVLLYLYQEHGIEGMLERLNGMFALCVVDLRQQAIYLARDRVGIKPLYWYLNDDTLLFSSETKSFLAHPAFKATLNSEVLDEFLAFRFVAGGNSLLNKVRELNPGHWMRITASGHTTNRYWSIPERQSPRSQPLEQSVELVQDDLRRSVTQRLLSDVPLGAQLSGGIDSSLVNLYASEVAGDRFKAFSIIVDNPAYSEERWIDQAANLADVDVHKSTMDPAYFADHFEAATWFMDQPLNLPNSVAVYQLAEMAKPQVSVLLSGEGADELFGGYPRFFSVAARQQLGWPLTVGRKIPGLGRRLGNHPDVAWSGSDDVMRILTSGAFLSSGQLKQLRPTASLETVTATRRQMFGTATSDPTTDALRYDLQVYLVDLLTRQDKMTMAHAVENRVPFLDHELIERVFELPTDHLVHLNLWPPSALKSREALVSYNTKIVLKKLAKSHFGTEFTYRRKEGLSLPLIDYFTHPRFRALVEDRLLPGIRERGILNSKTVDSWWQAATRGAPSVPQGLWVAFAFETWAQLILDGGWRNAPFAAAADL